MVVQSMFGPAVNALYSSVFSYYSTAYSKQTCAYIEETFTIILPYPLTAPTTKPLTKYFCSHG